MDLSVIPTDVYLPGLTTDFFSTRMPEDWIVDTITDVDFRFYGTPDMWRPGSAQGLWLHGATGDLSSRGLFATNGIVQTYLSFNGTGETLYPSIKAIPNLSQINGIEVMRLASTGDLTIKTTRNRGGSWQLHEVISTPAGALHTTKADLSFGIGAPTGLTHGYKGLFYKAEVRSDTVGGLIRAQCDSSRAWRTPKWNDLRQNEWTFHNTASRWLIDRSGIAPRTHEVDLHNLYGWTIRPTDCDGVGTAPTIQVVTGGRIIVPRDRTVSSFTTRIETAGTGLVASGSMFALCDMFGNRIAATAGLSSSDLTTGDKVLAMTASLDLLEGEYLGVMEFQGTTAPKIASKPAGNADVNSGGSASLGYPFFTADTGVTSIPTLLGAHVKNDVAYYLGLR